MNYALIIRNDAACYLVGKLERYELSHGTNKFDDYSVGYSFSSVVLLLF